MNNSMCANKYYIFGAHSRAQTLGVYLKQIHPDWRLLGFLYDDNEANPEEVDGVPVIKIPWLSAFANNQVDVLLPVPLYVRPSLKDNFCDRHTPAVWDEMMRVLEKDYPECADMAHEFFEKTGCYSPCNMLIARKNVLDDMCSFVFGIVFKVMEKCGTLEDRYQNRYPGFLAERLMTFYFYWKEDVYKIAYVDKTFLS